MRSFTVYFRNVICFLFILIFFVFAKSSFSGNANAPSTKIPARSNVDTQNPTDEVRQRTVNLGKMILTDLGIDFEIENVKVEDTEIVSLKMLESDHGEATITPKKVGKTNITFISKIGRKVVYIIEAKDSEASAVENTNNITDEAKKLSNQIKEIFLELNIDIVNEFNDKMFNELLENSTKTLLFERKIFHNEGTPILDFRLVNNLAEYRLEKPPEQFSSKEMETFHKMYDETCSLPTVVVASTEMSIIRNGNCGIKLKKPCLTLCVQIKPKINLPITP